MKEEGLTPVADVFWTDLHKTDDYGYYGIVLHFYPKTNEEHKKFLAALKAQCLKDLTGQNAKPPYWATKKDKDVFGVRFTSKFNNFEWMDAEEKEIPPPRMLVRGSKIRIKYKMRVSGSGRFMNMYMNGVQVIEIPAKEPAKGKDNEWEDPDDVPF